MKSSETVAIRALAQLIELIASGKIVKSMNRSFTDDGYSLSIEITRLSNNDVKLFNVSESLSYAVTLLKSKATFLTPSEYNKFSKYISLIEKREKDSNNNPLT
jgi:hypothetical protein